jgi:hypothetical protein
VKFWAQPRFVLFKGVFKHFQVTVCRRFRSIVRIQPIVQVVTFNCPSSFAKLLDIALRTGFDERSIHKAEDNFELWML